MKKICFKESNFCLSLKYILITLRLFNKNAKITASLRILINTGILNLPIILVFSEINLSTILGNGNIFRFCQVSQVAFYHCTDLILVVKHIICRSVLRTQSNIYDGEFLRQQFTAKEFNYFCKNSPSQMFNCVINTLLVCNFVPPHRSRKLISTFHEISNFYKTVIALTCSKFAKCFRYLILVMTSLFVKPCLYSLDIIS